MQRRNNQPQVGGRQVTQVRLPARRPVEFAFIARVIQLVNEGKLPLSVVDSTYLWARTKPHNPFQYFERALRAHAARLGVTI